MRATQNRVYTNVGSLHHSTLKLTHSSLARARLFAASPRYLSSQLDHTTPSSTTLAGSSVLPSLSENFSRPGHPAGLRNTLPLGAKSDKNIPYARDAAADRTGSIGTDCCIEEEEMSGTETGFLLLATLDRLLSHFRFLVTLRSREGEYHPLILFRLTPDQGQGNPPCEHAPDLPGTARHQLYAMEANCPHLGADMSHADIEECETGIVAVCPWHRYDFDLRTGKSETGLRACTYAVEVRLDDDGVEHVWVETPSGGSDWRLVELRPVSEAFADPPVQPPDISHLAISSTAPAAEEDIVPKDDAPTTLVQWAVLILNTGNPLLKVQRTRHAVELFRTGQLKSIGHRSPNAPRPPDIPPREEAYSRNTVDPAKTARRKNRAMMLHALANIEQWAIDLAWDIMARYGAEHPDLPPAFFTDFAKMALDEAKHFTLLTSRLAALSPSTAYGSLPVHASLWESAQVTFPSLRSRLAIIHLVHEARGLDVNPGTIERFRRAGDLESVSVLETIHHDEVTHVTTGHRWFTWLCAKQGVDPVVTFREEVKRGWRGDVKGPFNVEDREKAGMTRDFYQDLKGEMGISTQNTPQIRVEY